MKEEQGYPPFHCPKERKKSQRIHPTLQCETSWSTNMQRWCRHGWVHWRPHENKDLRRSHYRTPSEDFGSTMRRTKDYILANEALDSSNDEEHEPFKKQHKKIKGEEPSNKRSSTRKSSPHPPRSYTLLNSPCSEILSYKKEEGYSIQTPPSIRSPLILERTRIYIAGIIVIMDMISRITTT